MICKKKFRQWKNEQRNPKPPTFGGKQKYWNNRYSKQGGQFHSKSDTNPRLPRQDSTIKPNDSSVKTSSYNGSGLYFPAKINGRDIDCLVDTGATLSLVSDRLWMLIYGKTKDLKFFQRDIVSAAGTPLSIKGQGSISIDVHGLTYYMDVVVADIDTDVIRGLDFLKIHKCKIDMDTESIEILGIRCPLVSSGTLG
ncbi:hypothetical protein DPMN_147265 [Dreissena polymorpha]|uniref:Peptidase A2 domain-containing protein n=1 Tax=Dreissena polymorpha TaxID=45954 RepID=A0A9D4IZ68_DREPO|nr:hypothetical protein DPMN_147265 [Dreissena polymorpha]